MSTCGRHFVTLEAMLEAPVGSNAYALLHVHADRLVLQGLGSVTGRELALPPAALNRNDAVRQN